MAQMGFKELVPEQFAGHIITCFYYPQHSNFSFETFYQKLSDIGTSWSWGRCYYNFQSIFSDQVIYPGKVTDAPCFRIGNIGHLTTQDMEHLLVCIKKVLGDMGVPIPII